jgi:Ino eighty subunit 1
LESPSSDDDYDEESAPNPFADSKNKFSAPPFTFLTAEDLENENRETAEDFAMTEKLMTQRNRIIQHNGTKETSKVSAKASVNGSVIVDDEEMIAAAEEKGKRAVPVTSAKAKAKRTASATKEKKPAVSVERPQEREPTGHLPAELDEDEEDDRLIDAFVKREYS